jgi:hypothetical protein
MSIGLLIGATVPASATAVVPNVQMTVKPDCTSTTSVCFDVTLTVPGNFNPGDATVKVTLDGHLKGQQSQFVLDISKGACTMTQPGSSSFFASCVLPASQNTGQANTFTFTLCFPATAQNLPLTKFDSWILNATLVDPDNDVDFFVNNSTTLHFPSEGAFPNTCPTPTPTPVPVTPTPAANTPLAPTGGLDLRLALVGLLIITAGAALFLVSAARGRPLIR